MNRYSSTKIKLDKSGNRVYGTTYYPNIPIQNSDSFLLSKTGDRLDDNLICKRTGQLYEERNGLLYEMEK